MNSLLYIIIFLKKIILILIQNLFSDVFFGVDDFPTKNVVRLETTVPQFDMSMRITTLFLILKSRYILFIRIYLPYNDRPPIFQKRPSIT